MKSIAKQIVATILGYQVRRLYKKNDFKVIGVVGSIGKTSTKLAISNVLEAKFKVRYQEGNYNDLVTVPLIFFNEELPSLFNPLAWLAVFWRNQKQLTKKYPYDFVVVEIGTDAPGQVDRFKNYLNLEIGLLTSITPEHMQFFDSLDEVAKEELSVTKMSSLVMANIDLCDQKYLTNIDNLQTYGINNPADFRLKADSQAFLVTADNEKLLDFKTGMDTEPQLYSLLAAVAVAHKMGLPPDEIKRGIKNFKSIPGRMQRLAGINGSTIIDDSYNSSPEAVKLALKSLYETKAPQKIAILGSMNELGAYSQEAHQEIGTFCDPKQIDLLITVGPDANKILAPTAEAKGCRVESFDSPYAAGEYLKPLIKKGAVILVKGSQNRVFAEEAIKSILKNPDDSQKLVRQSPAWMKIKRKAFVR